MPTDVENVGGNSEISGLEMIHFLTDHVTKNFVEFVVDIILENRFNSTIFKIISIK